MYREIAHRLLSAVRDWLWCVGGGGSSRVKNIITFHVGVGQIYYCRLLRCT